PARLRLPPHGVARRLEDPGDAVGRLHRLPPAALLGCTGSMRTATPGSPRGRPLDLTPDFLSGYLGSRLVEGGRELPPGADLQLPVHVREVELDRLHGHEELLRDLLVAAVAGGEVGDAALARGERLDAAADHAPRAGARGRELLVRALDERGRAAAVGELR